MAVLVSAAVMSADHAESPGADADPAADLADVFIFPSPETTNRTVAAITFGGRSAPRSRIDGSFYCDPNVLYTLHIDRADAAGNFDSVPEIEIYARFAKDSGGACGLQLQNVPGAGGTFSGAVDGVFTSPSGLKAFAGLRNDPFFFDAEGYAALAASFAGAYLLSESERLRNVHVALGYTALGLLAFRLVWGFIGPRYARFSSFVHSPVAAFRYPVSYTHLTLPTSDLV